VSPRARLLRPLLALLACAGPLRAGENLAVIVNPDCGVSQLSREEVVEIYMGRQKRLPTGLLALPVEQVSPLETRARFYQTLVNLPLPQVRAYWARLYFSGQAQPPRQTGSDEETLEVVAANKGAIGFVDASKVDRRVRAVLQLETR
jgi:ABC-type phosphate transport system substrate-binding protein